MKSYLPAILLFAMTIPAISQTHSDTIKLADPTIFPHNNKFYLYGTAAKNTDNGFLVYVSNDLKSWKLFDKNNGYALKKGDAFGKKGFWAPQVFAYQQKFYMAYTANEQIAIAVSDSPSGPFVQQKKDSLPSTIKQIDPYVFIDDDGKKYLYHVRLTNGNRIFVAEMQDDLSSIKIETLQECISGELPWENTHKATWPVTEGPTVVKQNDIYYLFYSANDFRNPDYAVGYATSNHPLGPWKKHMDSPIIERNILGANGTGHGDLFQKDGQWYFVFHTHRSDKLVIPRKTALVKIKHENDHLWKILPSSFEFLKTK